MCSTSHSILHTNSVWLRGVYNCCVFINGDCDNIMHSATVVFVCLFFGVPIHTLQARRPFNTLDDNDNHDFC